MKSNKFYFGAFVTFLAFCLFFFFFFGFGVTRAQSHKKMLKSQKAIAYHTDGAKVHEAAKKAIEYTDQHSDYKDYSAEDYKDYSAEDYKDDAKDYAKEYSAKEYSAKSHDAKDYSESKDADYSAAYKNKEEYDYYVAAYTVKGKSNLKYDAS